MKEADFITYLSGALVKDDNFISLKETPIRLLKKYEKLLALNLKFLLINNPEKIIGLYNLEIDYIDNLLTKELNKNLDMTINAGIKAASSKNEEDIMTLVFLISFLDKENQLIFKHVLQKTMKEKNIIFYILFVKEESFNNWMQPNNDDSDEDFVFCIKETDIFLVIDDSIN